MTPEFKIAANQIITLGVLANDIGVKDIANAVLTLPNLINWSGSSKPHQHHYGKHGLIQHIFEVVHIALMNNAFFASIIKKDVDEKHLYLAALYHDIGKLYDYQPKNEEQTEWEGNQHKYRIHHISRSALIWNENKIKFNYQDPDDDVLHAILSHHGQRAWGSPVAPKTRLAWILHLSDSLSARVNDVDKEPNNVPN